MEWMFFPVFSSSSFEIIKNETKHLKTFEITPSFSPSKILYLYVIKHLKLYVSPNVQGSVSIHKIPTTKAKKLIVDSKQNKNKNKKKMEEYFILSILIIMVMLHMLFFVVLVVPCNPQIHQFSSCNYIITRCQSP